MTREEVLELAMEAGFWGVDIRYNDDGSLERFAALIAAAEREACEVLHDHDDVLAPVGNGKWGESYQQGWTDGTAAYLAAIRARGIP